MNDGIVDELTGVATWFLPARGPSAVRWAHARGFRYLHLDRHDLIGQDVAAMRSLSRDLDVMLAGLSISDLEVTGIRGVEAIAAISDAVTTAAALAIDYVYLPAFGAAQMRTAADIVAMAELLKFALATARENGVTIATENSLPTTELTTLFDLVGDDDLDLLFDTQNLSIRGIDPLHVIATHGERVRQFVHVKDGTTGLGNRPLGAGWADVASSLRALCCAGFGGVYVLESDYRSLPLGAPAADQAMLNRLIARTAPVRPITKETRLW